MATLNAFAYLASDFTIGRHTSPARFISSTTAVALLGMISLTEDGHMLSNQYFTLPQTCAFYPSLEPGVIRDNGE